MHFISEDMNLFMVKLPIKYIVKCFKIIFSQSFILLPRLMYDCYSRYTSFSLFLSIGYNYETI